MLKSKTRSRLKTHKWVSLEKKLSNPSQFLNRIKDLSITGLDDLALISNTIPESIQDEIFTSRKLEPMLDKILKLQISLTHSPSVNRLDTRRTQLCAMLVRKSVTFLKLQYQFVERDSPRLAEIILKQLEDAAKISNEITNKVELLSLRNIGTRTNLGYLFNWNRVTQDDGRLWSFLFEELGEPFSIETIKRNRNGRVLQFDLISEFDEVLYSVKIELGIDGDKAMLTIENDLIKKDIQLIIRTENDELYVFKKINE